jgi:hypothetical protein
MEIVSIIRPTITDLLAREDQSSAWNAEAKNPADTIYIAWGNPHLCYGETFIGQYDTEEEAEEAVRQFGYGGYVQKTLYAEFYSEKF